MCSIDPCSGILTLQPHEEIEADVRQLAIKKYQRSAADHNLRIAEEVRPPEVEVYACTFIELTK
jgi:hypothetical protein